MKMIYQLKYDQHPEVREYLLSTGNQELIENSPVDYFWGGGADGTGQNWIGKIWMEIRDKNLKS